MRYYAILIVVLVAVGIYAWLGRSKVSPFREPAVRSERVNKADPDWRVTLPAER